MAEYRQIDIYAGHSALSFDESSIRTLFRTLDNWGRLAIPMGELSIALLTDESLASLHRTFLQDPSPTDVITFPGSDPGEAGEICVSVDTAASTARDLGLSLSYELNLYLVHGWLHLAGLSDKTPDAAEHMRRAEEAAFEFLKKNTPLPEFYLRTHHHS